MTIKDIEKVVNLAIGSFWEKNLEPLLTEMSEDIKVQGSEIKKLATKDDLKRVEDKVDDLDDKVADLTLEVKANGRKLDAEVSYRDRLDKRVKVLEKSH